MSATLWQQLADKLIERIAKGVYLPGMFLPNIHEIAREFEVSSGTVSRALRELKKRNIVINPPGKGVVVKAHTPESSLFHFFRFRHEDGAPVTPLLIEQHIHKRRATQLEHSELFGNPDKVFEIERIRTCNSKTCGLETIVVSADLFSNLDKLMPLPNTLYVLFQSQYFIVVVSAEENLTCNPLGKIVAAKTNLIPGIPTLIAKRKAFDLLGRVVELRTSQYITDSVYYSITMG